MEKPGFLIQHFMIAGLLAAIGVVVLAGQSQAGNRYCTYYPEDPNCFDAIYGQGASPALGDEDGQFEDGIHLPICPRAKFKSCHSIAVFAATWLSPAPVDCGGVDYKYVAYLGYSAGCCR
jgi:hypothetical protein